MDHFPYPNKSIASNFIACLLIVIGYMSPDPFGKIILTTGLFSLSGALTNALAIHMLFEKVPYLYGTGVIPSRFEAFKQGLHDLMMQEFFNSDNIDRFLTRQSSSHLKDGLDLTNILDPHELNPAFDSLLALIMESKFGSALAMFGGQQTIEFLRIPFINKLKQSLDDITRNPAFQERLKSRLNYSTRKEEILKGIEHVVQERLNELTPQLVKAIIQEMIRSHLGWLVVWGAVFGGMIGLLTAFLSFLY